MLFRALAVMNCSALNIKELKNYSKPGVEVKECERMHKVQVQSHCFRSTNPLSYRVKRVFVNDLGSLRNGDENACKKMR